MYTYFIIRHKETYEFMPLAKRGKGYSYWNPFNSELQNPSWVISNIPRLFATEREANLVIASWAKGYYTYKFSLESGDSYKEYHKDNRKKSDLEIIKCDITFDEY